VDNDMSNQKVGLDYFPLDVDIEQDDKIALIQAKHGLVGFAIIIKLFAKIYADKGYYYEWNDKTSLLFAGRMNVEYDKINEIILDAIEWEIFDKKKFKKYQILTSKRIQETYLEATKRRKKVDIFKPFLVINGHNDYILRDNVNILREDSVILKQSKVKESKVKESKEKEKKNKYMDSVFLTKTEHGELVKKYGANNTKKMIIKLNNYKEAHGKKYKSDYRAILSWVVESVFGKGKKVIIDEVDLEDED
jgi:hypothetical protein